MFKIIADRKSTFEIITSEEEFGQKYADEYYIGWKSAEFLVEERPLEDEMGTLIIPNTAVQDCEKEWTNNIPNSINEDFWDSYCTVRYEIPRSESGSLQYQIEEIDRES